MLQNKKHHLTTITINIPPVKLFFKSINSLLICAVSENFSGINIFLIIRICKSKKFIIDLQTLLKNDDFSEFYIFLFATDNYGWYLLSPQDKF